MAEYWFGVVVGVMRVCSSSMALRALVVASETSSWSRRRLVIRGCTAVARVPRAASRRSAMAIRSDSFRTGRRRVAQRPFSNDWRNSLSAEAASRVRCSSVAVRVVFVARAIAEMRS